MKCLELDDASLQKSFDDLYKMVMEKLEGKEGEKKTETSKKQVALDKAAVDEMITKAINSAEVNIYDTMWNCKIDSRMLDDYVERVAEIALTKLDDEIKALRTEMEGVTEARISKIEEKFNETLKGVEERCLADVKQLQEDNYELSIRVAEVMHGKLPASEQDWVS